MLDGGYLAKVCGIAMSAHWIGVLMMMFQRPFAPTVMDRLYIRAGFLMIFLPLIPIWDLIR
jgi:hypothetical protein